ncbi:hypothetical protein ACK14O_14330 [Vibrio harveyi]|uniref:hypothetical protein n=1 Tax=Vibrio harveyi TaxID=669 RepID=UPI00390AA69D
MDLDNIIEAVKDCLEAEKRKIEAFEDLVLKLNADVPIGATKEQVFYKLKSYKFLQQRHLDFISNHYFPYSAPLDEDYRENMVRFILTRIEDVVDLEVS